MTDTTPTRRGLLRATGGIAALALAGCTGSSGTGTASDGGDGGGTTTQATASGGGTSTPADETAHSHHSGHHHEAVPDEPAASAEVRMLTSDGSHHFSPHVVWVETGGTVTFVNESGSHSATAYAPDNDEPRRIPEGGTAFDTGTLTEAGASREVTFETPGVYDYYCIPHETLGMVGSVIVGRPDAHGQPGLSEPTEVPEAIHEKVRGLNETVNEALGHTHEQTTESAHHEESTESGHHDGTTESGHHDGTDSDGHHDGTTESGHHGH